MQLRPGIHPTCTRTHIAQICSWDQTPDIVRMREGDALPPEGLVPSCPILYNDYSEREYFGARRHISQAMWNGAACPAQPSTSGPSYLDRKSTRLNSSHLGISY